jgi:ANTAR domain/GAF domain
MADEPLSIDLDPATVGLFHDLAGLVYAADGFPQVYDAIVDAARRLVPGCDHASLMILREGVFETTSASDDVAEHVDRLERELGEGPCLDAIESDSAYHDSDILARSQWPRLTERVLAETPVRGMAGFRVLAGDGRVGALNLFSDRPSALTLASVDRGVVLASFLSVALVAAHERRAASTLRQGLTSNREIGKAIGLLMAQHKIGDEEAFALLRRASQDMNVKLAEVARQVVDRHNQS